MTASFKKKSCCHNKLFFSIQPLLIPSSRYPLLLNSIDVYLLTAQPKVASTYTNADTAAGNLEA
jgi:hypothetical protein